MTKTEKKLLKGLSSKIGSGATPRGGDSVYIEKGISFIRSQNVYNLSFCYDGLAHITEEDAKKLDGVSIQENDILLNITGDSVARTCIVPEDILPARVNQHVAIIRLKNEVCSKFISYYLASPFMQAYMLNLAKGKGASRNALTKGMIENFPIFLPPYPVQQKIAGILSAYDDLIENNQKQIKLLEEAAQRLYKEWFVDFRFPGHENAKFINGLPEGWSLKRLSDVAPIITGKKDANFGTDNGRYLFFTCAQEPITASSYSFDCNAVILAGNGDFNVKLYRGKFEAYQRTYVLSPFKNEYLYLLFYAVRENMRHLFQGASGSTIKFLTKPMLENISVFIPPKELLIKYNVNTETIQRKIETLKETVILTKEARDRLLPKLINGEIEV